MRRRVLEFSFRAAVSPPDPHRQCRPAAAVPVRSPPVAPRPLRAFAGGGRNGPLRKTPQREPAAPRTDAVSDGREGPRPDDAHGPVRPANRRFGKNNGQKVFISRPLSVTLLTNGGSEVRCRPVRRSLFEFYRPSEICAL